MSTIIAAMKMISAVAAPGISYKDKGLRIKDKGWSTECLAIQLSINWEHDWPERQTLPVLRRKAA
jgi:hypothetical protein